jgi:hypothetical protein
MADTQTAPQAPAGLQPIPALGGSITEAQEALLSLEEPEEETPQEEEAQPTEVEESQPEEEDESFEEESEEESTDTDEEAEEDLLYAVTVNGEEQEVSLGELMKGYSRQSDYTRKTQEVSEQRKEFDAMKQQMAQEYQQIQAERQHYVQNLQSFMEGSMSGLDQFAEVNWDLLKETDPIEFVTKKEEFREAQEKMQRLQQDQYAAQQRGSAQAQQEHRRTLAEEGAALVKAVPEWGDTDKKQEMAGNLRSYAMENGFTKEELDSLIDHRSILVLLKAQKYDKLQKTDVKSKKLKNKPRVVRAGSGVSKDETSSRKRSAQMKRLRGTGHIDDASALLEDFIDI